MTASNIIGSYALGKVGSIDLDTIPKLEDCNPGFEYMMEFNVLVVSPVVAEKIGNIIMADSTKQQAENAAQAARLVMVSEAAFNYDKDIIKHPVVGDVIYFSRHSGAPFIGADGLSYRIIKDKDIMGVFGPNKEQ